MKIDTSKIAGYESMTVEQKIAAIEGFEFDTEPGEGYISKKLFDKTSSELADAKRKLKEKMTKDEQDEADRVQRFNDLETKYNELLKKSTIDSYKAKFAAQGYTEELASETAQAMFDGDMTKVFENQQKFLGEYEKRIKLTALESMKRPGVDMGAGAEDDAIKMAQEMAKERSAQSKSYDEIMSQYE